MPSYEFQCLSCGGITCYLLRDGAQDIALRHVRCEWCQHAHVRLIQYFRNADEVINQLQDQIALLQARIAELENPDADVQDKETVM